VSANSGGPDWLAERTSDSGDVAERASGGGVTGAGDGDGGWERRTESR
jgi:hypothetical protein